MKRRMIRAILGLALCLCFASRAAPADEGSKKPKAPKTAKTFTLPGFGDLTLLLPEGWDATLEHPSDGSPPRIKLTDSAIKELSMTIAPANSARDKEPATVERARKMLEEQGKGLIVEAKESSLDIQELNGPEARGFWFALTRQNTRAAALPHATHVRVAIGDVMLAGTIVQRFKSGPGQRAGLEILRTVTLKPAPKPAAAAAATTRPATAPAAGKAS
jgi:hypothetical protein